MSWRSGAELFREIWPMIPVHIPEPAVRQEFLERLLTLFLEWDVDPETVADLHSEVRQALGTLGVEVKPPGEGQDDVTCCVRQLGSPSDKERITAAQAIEFFVHQAPDPTYAARIALGALVKALSDSSFKVRRALAKSIGSLLAEGFDLPTSARKGLQAAANDEDEVVRKQVEKAMKRIDGST